MSNLEQAAPASIILYLLVFQLTLQVGTRIVRMLILEMALSGFSLNGLQTLRLKLKAKLLTKNVSHTNSQHVINFEKT